MVMPSWIIAHMRKIFLLGEAMEIWGLSVTAAGNTLTYNQVGVGNSIPEKEISKNNLNWIGSSQQKRQERTEALEPNQ